MTPVSKKVWGHGSPFSRSGLLIWDGGPCLFRGMPRRGECCVVTSRPISKVEKKQVAVFQSKS